MVLGRSLIFLIDTIGFELMVSTLYDYLLLSGQNINWFLAWAGFEPESLIQAKGNSPCKIDVDHHGLCRLFLRHISLME